jgi:hypothetical protein
MGLDMYLYKRTYVQKWEHHTPEKTFDVLVKRGGITYPNVKSERIVYVIEQVGYWRKFHPLNEWFFKTNSSDSTEFYVGREKLIELLNLLKLQQKNPNEEILVGFDIKDEWFEHQLKRTIPMLEEILSEDDEDDFIYSASW